LIANFPVEEYEPPTVTIWQRINRLLWVVIVLTVVALIIGAFLPELEKQRDERRKNDDLQRSIDQQKAINRHLQNQVGWLQNDPDYLAIFARDKRNMMKEGESILIIDPPKAPALQPEPVVPPPGSGPARRR
jgi:cell division protein FtsB